MSICTEFEESSRNNLKRVYQSLSHCMSTVNDRSHNQTGVEVSQTNKVFDEDQIVKGSME